MTVEKRVYLEKRRIDVLGFFSFKELYVAKGALRVFHVLVQIRNVVMFLQFLGDPRASYFYGINMVGDNPWSGVFFFFALALAIRAGFESMYLLFQISDDVKKSRECLEKISSDKS